MDYILNELLPFVGFGGETVVIILTLIGGVLASIAACDVLLHDDGSEREW